MRDHHTSNFPRWARGLTYAIAGLALLPIVGMVLTICLVFVAPMAPVAIPLLVPTLPEDTGSAHRESRPQGFAIDASADEAHEYSKAA